MAGLPVLYTFRRCPYAIRARIGLYLCGVDCVLREVVLRDKPQEMLAVSPKGTVPVLQLADGTVIDESLDVITYAFGAAGAAAAEARAGVSVVTDVPAGALELIKDIDTGFAGLLKLYKYHYRNPERTQAEYRADIEAAYLTRLEAMLEENGGYLFAGGGMSLADIAVVPLIRQFAHVDKDWFFGSRYTHLVAWLGRVCDAAWFDDVIMKKHKQWCTGDPGVRFLAVSDDAPDAPTSADS